MLTKVRKLTRKVIDARRPSESLPQFARRLWIWRARTAAAARRKIDAQDVRAVTKLLKSGRIAYGPQVGLLQDEFTRLYGVRHAACSTSGTAAIHVALAMIRLEPGDEVIIPPITDIGTLLPILAQNAIPIIADVNAESWCLDPEKVKSVVTPRTRAIIAVHLFGNPCDLDGLKRVSEPHGIYLIEDCAQAHWAAYHEKPIGTVGHVGTFSLQWTKHITSCEGGVTITNHPEFGERGRLFVDKGWNRGAPDGARQYPMFGLNYRMSEMQAALARTQLRKVKSLISRRNRNVRVLLQMLEDTPGIQFQRVEPDCTHAYWQIGMTVDADAPFTADSLAGMLARRRIPCSAHYIGRPIHQCHEPLLQRRIYGTSDLPFELSERAGELDYREMRTPVAQDVLNRLTVMPVPNEHFSEKMVETMAGEIREVVDQLSNPTKMQVKPGAKFRLGLVGCGKIALQHLEAVRRIPQIQVVAVSDVNETALKTVGSQFGVENRYTDYREMLEREELEIIQICVWPELHAEVTGQAARHGVRAVLCEKPIASNLGEASAMLTACRDSNTLLVIGHQHRFNPHLTQARELIQAGEIGTVRHSWAHCWSSLLNNGSHLVDGLLYMLGDAKVEWVLGQIHRSEPLFDRGQPVESGSMGMLCFENGVRANIEMGETAVPEIGWHFYGDRGKLDVGVDALTVVGQKHRRPKRIQHARVASMQDQMIELLEALVDQPKEHRGAGPHGYAAMEIVTAILESARLAEPVRLPVTQMRYPLDVEVAGDSPVPDRGARLNR